MKWLEIINLRSAGNRNQVQRQTGLDQIRHCCGKNGGPKRIRLYRQASLSRDISIHLFFEDGERHIEKSETGLRLSASLKEYGLVNHSLWILEDDLPESPSDFQNGQWEGTSTGMHQHYFGEKS